MKLKVITDTNGSYELSCVDTVRTGRVIDFSKDLIGVNTYHHLLRESKETNEESIFNHLFYRDFLLLKSGIYRVKRDGGLVQVAQNGF